MTTAHHPHGPSAIGNPCNAAWKAGLNAPALPASDDADEGTLMHATVACPWPESLDALDSEQRAAVERCLAQAEAWTASLSAIAPYVERRLDLWDADGTLINYGTLDWIVLAQDGARAILADWKMGRLSSPAVADQLANYAAMALQNWPMLESVEAHAWYPRAPALNQSWTYTRADLPGLIERIKARIAIRIDPERWEYTTGDWCRYCKAALICGARRQDLATVESSAMTVESLAPADIAALLPRLKRVEKIGDAIKARAKALAGAGQLPGYRLAEVRGREALTGTTLDHAEALTLAGFTTAELWESVEFDLAKIRAIAKEKPLPPDAVLAPKQSAVDYHLATLAPFIGRGAGYSKLVETKE